jgi:hypothetical protein
MALEIYVELVDDHMDAAYLKLHAALEGFARELISTRGEAPARRDLVKEWSEWKAFVHGLQDELRYHAADERALDRLVGKIIASGRAPSGNIVEEAFEQLERPLIAKLRDELGHRNRTAHTALMSSTDGRDVDHDLRRVEIMRTIVAALIALSTDYRHPLAGWERDPLGCLIDAPAEFWPASFGDDASYFFADAVGDDRARALLEQGDESS